MNGTVHIVCIILMVQNINVELMPVPITVFNVISPKEPCSQACRANAPHPILCCSENSIVLCLEACPQAIQIEPGVSSHGGKDKHK